MSDPFPDPIADGANPTKTLSAINVDVDDVVDEKTQIFLSSICEETEDVSTEELSEWPEEHSPSKHTRLGEKIRFIDY